MGKSGVLGSRTAEFTKARSEMDFEILEKEDKTNDINNNNVDYEDDSEGEPVFENEDAELEYTNGKLSLVQIIIFRGYYEEYTSWNNEFSKNVSWNV